MVATSSQTAPLCFSRNTLTVLTVPPSRQSSLRSVSSTHSRGSFKVKPVEINPSNNDRRRVHFSSVSVDAEGYYGGEYNSKDSEDSENVTLIMHEYESIEPIVPLYLSCNEILKIRSDARMEAYQFAQAYPDFVEDVYDLFENGVDSLNYSSQVKYLRQPRQRVDPYEIALQSIDRDDEANVTSERSNRTSYDDDQETDIDNCIDDSLYFPIMRGLEARVCPIFRMSRRNTIQNVLSLQQEMKNSGCNAAQIRMGLRALYAQLSQKHRDFSFYQACLDEYEAKKEYEAKVIRHKI